MFGLLRPRLQLVPRADRRDYSSAYCNLCAALSARYGLKARMLVVHDVAAADWLLAAARPVSRPYPINNCLKGGIRSVRRPFDLSPRQTFLAAVSAYTIGVKVRDDRADRGSWQARLAGALYDATFRRAYRDLLHVGFDAAAFDTILAEQDRLEREQATDLERAAGPSGRAFGLVARHLAVLQGDLPADVVQALGERLGRCVYLVDAYQDYEQDTARGNYNPLRGTRLPAPALLAERREALAACVSDLRAEARALCGELGPRVALRFRAVERPLLDVLAPSCRTDLARAGDCDCDCSGCADCFSGCDGWDCADCACDGSDILCCCWTSDGTSPSCCNGPAARKRKKGKEPEGGKDAGQAADAAGMDVPGGPGA